MGNRSASNKPLPRKQRVFNRGYLYSRSDEDIKDKANLMLESGDYLDALEYSHTMGTDMWDITDNINGSVGSKDLKCKCDCDEQMKEYEATSSNV